MEAWIPITVAAAFLQNARSALQKALKGRVGPTGATFVRFGYGLPFALAYAAVLWTVEPGGVGAVGSGWMVSWFTALAVGAVAQILATAALLASFAHDNFAVGTAYSKTEPIQAALFGAVLLGEAPTVWVALAIAIGVGGVALMSWKPGAGARAWFGPAAQLGLLAAALFGISAVSYRAAALSPPDGSAALRAAVTLAGATALQTALMVPWMLRCAREEIGAVLRSWRPGLLTGLAGAGASACWFTAMALEPAAHVRALGQIEMVFTVLASALVFRERPSLRDILGVALVAGGVALLLSSA